MDKKLEAEAKVLYRRIIELLDPSGVEESPELLNCLSQYWALMSTEFDTKMEPWKAQRIYDISWEPPVLEFRIERHPAAWNRVQRWEYNFSSNKAISVSEWSPPENPRYTRQQVQTDAQQIVDAILRDELHPCLQRKGHFYYVWMGRLPQTKPIAYLLPRRTAKGRQGRLKAEIASVMQAHSGFARQTDKETSGSLVYRRL